ncbi:MAG: stp 8 [Pseudonocardiales bacterium]|nr:stp 8 [Pseudonocardiales bacterium]
MNKRWLLISAMTAALSMVMLDQTVVSVALPTMARDLPLSPQGVQWVVNAYVLAMAALVAFGGKLGDLLGRVTAFRFGVILFFVASVGCALTPSGSMGETWLLIARGLQGAGAAAMLPASAALVMASSKPSERGKAMAIYAGTSQMFLAIGPLLGGVLTEYASWRWVFWINVPVGLAALTLVKLAAPANPRQTDAPVRITDLMLLIAGIGPLVLGVQQGGTWGWASTATLVPLLGGALLLGLFVIRQLGADDPLVRVQLFSRRPFLADILVVTLVQFGLLAIVLFGSLYLQDLLHYSPIQAGLATLPIVLPLTVATRIGGQWFDRTGVRGPVLAGLTLSIVGIGLWAVGLSQLSYWWQLPGMALTGLGIGLTISPTNTDALGRMSDADRGQASGLLQTARQLGGTFGVAAIGAIIVGIEHDGTRANIAQHAADAVAVGFGFAAAAFAVAAVIAYFLLGRESASRETNFSHPGVDLDGMHQRTQRRLCRRRLRTHARDRRRHDDLRRR